MAYKTLSWEHMWNGRDWVHDRKCRRVRWAERKRRGFQNKLYLTNSLPYEQQFCSHHLLKVSTVSLWPLMGHFKINIWLARVIFIFMFVTLQQWQYKCDLHCRLQKLMIGKSGKTVFHKQSLFSERVMLLINTKKFLPQIPLQYSQSGPAT